MKRIRRSIAAFVVIAGVALQAHAEQCRTDAQGSVQFGDGRTGLLRLMLEDQVNGQSGTSNGKIEFINVPGNPQRRNYSGHLVVVGNEVRYALRSDINTELQILLNLISGSNVTGRLRETDFDAVFQGTRVCSNRPISEHAPIEEQEPFRP